MKYLFAVFLLLFVHRALGNRCTIAQKCVTDYSQADCFGNQVLVENSHIYGCCPICQPPPGEVTIPETGCRPPANCLPDGRYAPVQCKGDQLTGRCFCSDEDGNRIFGQTWRSDATKMTCACSRRRAELEATENRSVTLHCTRTGDYELLQCDDGMCWCAQSTTGQPLAGPVPEVDMKLLPCYSESAMGEQYLRRCESSVHALATISKEQMEHGTSFLGNPITFCDYDGSYGPFQIRNGVAYCTDRNGEIMGSWQTMSNTMQGMNCNCARDTNIYFPERGMMVTETCQANGNYMPNQNVGSSYYCVDTDGYPTTDMLTAWPADTCQSFA